MRRRTFLRQPVARTGLGALGAALVGCSQAGRAPATESTGPATVRWPAGAGAPQQEFAKRFNERFNATHGPKITAVAEPLPAEGNREVFEKWTTMAVAGQLPEIVELCCTWVRPFILNGLVQDLTPFIRRDWKPADTNDFYKSPYGSFTIERKQYGLPGNINLNTLFVNKNHLREAALPYPSESWSRDHFVTYVSKLHRPDGERWGFDMPFHWLDRNVTWIWSHGGEPHDPNDGPAVTKLTYDDPKTIEALELLHDVVWKQRVSPTTNEQRGGMNMTDTFLNGKSAVYFDGSNKASDLSTKGPGTGLDWDFLPLVKGPGGYGARHSLDGWLMDKQTKVADAAWTLLREMHSAETHLLRTQVLRTLSARRSAAGAWEQLYPGKNAKVVRLMAETSRADPRGFWKDANEVGPLVQNTYMRATFIENKLPVAQAMRQAMADVRAFYAANK